MVHLILSSSALSNYKGQKSLRSGVELKVRSLVHSNVPISSQIKSKEPLIESAITHYEISRCWRLVIAASACIFTQQLPSPPHIHHIEPAIQPSRHPNCEWLDNYRRLPRNLRFISKCVCVMLTDWLVQIGLSVLLMDVYWSELTKFFEMSSIHLRPRGDRGLSKQANNKPTNHLDEWLTEWMNESNKIRSWHSKIRLDIWKGEL